MVAGDEAVLFRLAMVRRRDRLSVTAFENRDNSVMVVKRNVAVDGFFDLRVWMQVSR